MRYVGICRSPPIRVGVSYLKFCKNSAIEYHQLRVKYQFAMEFSFSITTKAVAAMHRLKFKIGLIYPHRGDST